MNHTRLRIDVQLLYRVVDFLYQSQFAVTGLGHNGSLFLSILHGSFQHLQLRWPRVANGIADADFSLLQHFSNPLDNIVEQHVVHTQVYTDLMVQFKARQKIFILSGSEAVRRLQVFSDFI